MTESPSPSIEEPQERKIDPGQPRQPGRHKGCFPIDERFDEPLPEPFLIPQPPPP